MKATLDIPDEVAKEVQRRARQDGRELVEQFVRLVELGLLAADVPAAEFERLVRSARAAPPSSAAKPAPLTLNTDPSTKLPVIDSPPDAPVRTMTLDEVFDLTRRALTEDDLERAGLPVRH